MGETGTRANSTFPLDTFLICKQTQTGSLINLKVNLTSVYWTKHLSTDADSSTDTTIGWTKNSRKPNFFEKRKKSSKTQKLKTAQRYANISDIPFDQRSLIHREAWFPPCFVRKNQQKRILDPRIPTIYRSVIRLWFWHHPF